MSNSRGAKLIRHTCRNPIRMWKLIRRGSREQKNDWRLVLSLHARRSHGFPTVFRDFTLSWVPDISGFLDESKEL